jgi:hypothetical protein
MKNFFMSFIVLIFGAAGIGCASTSSHSTTSEGTGVGPEPGSAQTVSTTKEAEVEAPAESKESSQVLTKNKKCPKRTKMVNGKCMLNVESND